MAEFIEDSDLEFSFEFIKRICTEIGPGSPCSPQEHARAMAVHVEMEKVADEVSVENFVCAPHAFIKWFPVACTLGLVATFFFYLGFLPAYSLLFTTIGFIFSMLIVLITVLEFVLYQEFIDGFYNKKNSENIVGIIRPRVGEKAKRILIFGGHHDSALQFTYLRHLKQGYYVTEILLILGGVILATYFALRLTSILYSLQWDWIVTAFQWHTCFYIPVSVFIGYTFTEPDRNGGSVPGAIDNLSAVAIILSIGRVLKRHPELLPSDTEIRLISFGCEEAGVRGSRAYVRAHEAELKNADTEFINFETIYNPEIEIFSKDRNGTIRNSPEIVEQLAESAQRARVPSKITNLPFGGGGTDAIPFREKGIKAACLFGMKIPSQMVQFYHQEWDNYHLVNQTALKNVLMIAVEFLRYAK